MKIGQAITFETGGKMDANVSVCYTGIVRHANGRICYTGIVRHAILFHIRECAYVPWCVYSKNSVIQYTYTSLVTADSLWRSPPAALHGKLPIVFRSVSSR